MSEYCEAFQEYGVTDYTAIKNMTTDINVNSKIGVYTLYLYSLGLDTLEKLVEVNGGYEKVKGDGDGTVCKVSLEYFKKFPHYNPLNSEIKIVPNIQHHTMIKSQETFDILKEFIEKRKNLWNKSSHTFFRSNSSLF